MVTEEMLNRSLGLLLVARGRTRRLKVMTMMRLKVMTAAEQHHVEVLLSRSPPGVGPNETEFSDVGLRCFLFGGGGF